MSWKGKLALGCLLAVLFFGLGLGPLLSPLLYTLTPLERQYLPAYIASSLHKNDPAAQTEIRWVLKLKPGEPEARSKRSRSHRSEPKPELGFARERDVMAVPVTDRLWSGDALPFHLSAEASQEGWTGLDWSVPQEISSGQLAAMLRDDYFEGRSWMWFFVQPLLAIMSLLMLILAGRIGLEVWREQRLWGRPQRRRELLWRWLFEPPKPEAVQTSVKVLEGEKPNSLPLPTAPSASPVRLPKAAVIAAPSPKSLVTAQSAPVVPRVPPKIVETAKPAFVWDESAGID